MSLIGRTKELDRIVSVIRRPVESSLTVTGQRGVGKSALMAEIPRLSNCQTLFLRASATESEWPLAGLTAMLNGINDPALNQLADELLELPAAEPAVPAISNSLLNGLRHRSPARMMLVIDDADRLDPSSQAVIGFLARRLSGTRVTLFISVREQRPEGPFGNLPALNLLPLGYTDTVRMLESIPAVNNAATAAHAVAAATQGNPLAAVELYAHLLERHAEGKYALPVPLHCRGSLDAEAAAKIATLTGPARRVLDLVALSCRSHIMVLERVNGGLLPGLDELLAKGLVSRSGEYVRIPDQLLRGYVFSEMAPADRTSNHRALADAANGTDPYASRWHNSFTVLERQTPFGLLRYAVDLIRAGETPFAVEYIERALTINPWEAETAARLTMIAELLFPRGHFVYAQRYLEWAQRTTRNPSLILRLAGLAFEIQFMQGDAVPAGMVLRLVKEFGQYDRSYAASLLAGAALYYAERWAHGDAMSLLRCADEFKDAASAECLAITERAVSLVDAVSGNTGHPGRKYSFRGTTATLLVQGRALSYSGYHEMAEEAFAVVRSSPDPDMVNWRETARCFAVDNEIRAGNVRKALRLIEDLELHEPEARYHAGMRHLFRVWRAFALGDEVLARRYVEEAQHFAGADGHSAVTAQLAAWQGQFALMRGNLAEAHAQLSRATGVGPAFTNPALVRCEPDLVEVLVRLGRHSEATRVLHRIENRSLGLRSPWLMAAVSRSRAMLADGEQSLQLFQLALSARTGHDSLVERARTMLCYAERLAAFGRRQDSKEALMHAKVIFDEAGADAWTQHVDSLLMDERVDPARSAGNPALLVLAEHERSLAQMVARGMRNKEIASSLYVSVRTVEVRLTAIYRKLGVESRAQLTALAADRDAAARSPYVLPAH